MYFQFRKMILLYETPNSKVPALYKTLVFLLFEYLSGSNRLFFGYKGKGVASTNPILRDVLLMQKEIFYVQCGVYNFKLSSSAQCVYFYLCKCANKEGFCFPGREKIRQETGLSLTTITRTIQELKSKGVIDFTPQFQKTKHETNRQTSNRYQILNLSKKG